MIARSIDSNETRNSELITAYVNAGETYKIRINSTAGSSTSQYLFRTKITTSQRQGKVFTQTSVQPNNLNTRYNATIILPELWEMGYDAGEYVDHYASSAYIQMPDCDLVVITSHGDEGRIYFYDDSFMTGGTATYGIPYCACLPNYATGALTRVKLLLFSGCNTGDSSSIHGNLVDVALSKDVMCCIGWTESFWDADIYYWHTKFFEKLSEGLTVGDAISETNAWIAAYATELSTITAQYYGSSALHALTLK
ncbi:MAG: hypothetical protein IJ043_04625 [Clostridia bacterium]|nr:hypothetical protein [Clostridia bacterium]